MSCGKSDDKNSKPLFQLVPQKTVEVIKPTPGYDKYVKACTHDVKDENTCRCQADILRKYLKDGDIGLVAQSGSAISQHDSAEAGIIMSTLPDVKHAVQRAAIEADSRCQESGVR